MCSLKRGRCIDIVEVDGGLKLVARKKLAGKVLALSPNQHRYLMAGSPSPSKYSDDASFPPPSYAAGDSKEQQRTREPMAFSATRPTAPNIQIAKQCLSPTQLDELSQPPRRGHPWKGGRGKGPSCCSHALEGPASALSLLLKAEGKISTTGAPEA